VVNAAWHTASNVLYADTFGNDPASLDAVNSSFREATGNDPGYRPVPEGPITISNEHGAVAAAIRWAAENLTAGSTAHQNVVGETLNSGYEDMDVVRARGSTNDSFATQRAQTLIDAGLTAVIWSQQLRGNS